MNWQTFFQDAPDFRMNRRKRFKLLDFEVVALSAVVRESDDFEEIEAYGRQKEAFLRTLFELPNGTPRTTVTAEILNSSSSYRSEIIPKRHNSTILDWNFRFV